jgi:hypothetical protein
MDSAIIDQMVKVCLREIHSRLSEAVRIAKAAEACANAEAGQSHGAASLLKRLPQQ